MRITKSQLKKLILEACGDLSQEDLSVVAVPEVEPVADVVVAESPDPASDMLVEMEVAARSLAMVVESVQNAAQLCTNCGEGVADKAPVVHALATQAEALQEMLEAQVSVLEESAAPHGDDLEGVVSVVDKVF